MPLNNVNVLEENKDDLINFFETLEDDDDVQNVYSNAKFVEINYVNYWNRSWYIWLNLFF